MADINAAKPPRLTEDPAQDFVITQGWMQDIYGALAAVNNEVAALTTRVTTLEARVTALEP